MRTSTRSVAIALIVAASASVSAGPATAAPGPVAPDSGSSPTPTATFDATDGSAAIDLLDRPARSGTVRAARAHESAVRASVRQRLELIPGFDAGHLAQILKNLDQGAL